MRWGVNVLGETNVQIHVPMVSENAAKAERCELKRSTAHHHHVPEGALYKDLTVSSSPLPLTTQSTHAFEVHTFESDGMAYVQRTISTAAK